MEFRSEGGASRSAHASDDGLIRIGVHGVRHFSQSLARQREPIRLP
jgi:hypothetical protein